MSKRFNIIEPAAIEWQNGQPYSTHFQDVYSSTTQGLEEKRYVFLEGNSLCERFGAQDEKQAFFAIGELGFGTGLNFLITRELWRQHAPLGATLTYYSCEQHPLKRVDLIACLHLWPALRPLADELIDAYPMLTPGFHLLTFDEGRVRLVLMLGEASDCFEQLVYSGDVKLESKINPLRIDAWYLDGFAPAKNESMWRERLFSCMALLSKKGTTFATYSAASVVKKGLESCGFDVFKMKGFGQKRHMLKGQWHGLIEKTAQKPKTPWYVSEAKIDERKKALIIGAGIAGCVVAHELAQRGWDVDVVDRHNHVAAGASGIDQAVLFPNFSAYHSPLTDWMLSAYLYAARYYAKHLEDGVEGELKGMLQLAYDADAKQYIHSLVAWLDAYPELGQPIDVKMASDLAGIALEHPALHILKSGWVSMRSLCEHITRHPRIHCHFQTSIHEIKKVEGEWEAGGFRAPVVVLCGGFDTTAFGEAQHLPIKAIGGQVSLLSTQVPLTSITLPICAEGHILPAYHGRHVFGASYRLDDAQGEVRVEDDASNLKKLQRVLPSFEPRAADVVGSWCGIRASTPDYLPIVGALPKPGVFSQCFAPLAANTKRFIDAACPVYEGLYVCAGLGSRGLTSAPLAGHFLASIIHQEPVTLPQTLYASLSPARFLYKKLIRGQAIACCQPHT